MSTFSDEFEHEGIPELFMNLSPFEMKTLLYHILSGKEFNVSRTTERQISFMNIDLPKRVGIKNLKKTIKVVYPQTSNVFFKVSKKTLHY